MPSPGTVTLATVRTQAQQRADMVNSSFVSTTEWNTNISNSYKELYDLLLSAYGNDYFIQTPYQFTTDGVNQQFSLPSDFYKLLGCELLINSMPNNPITLRKFNFPERNRLNMPGARGYWGRYMRYCLVGNTIWLAPLPQSGQTVQIWYAPEPTALVNDTDSFDGISGWEEYIVVDAAIKALAKEESDVSVLVSQKNAMLARIQAMAENRDAGAPATVTDSQSAGVYDYAYPFGDPWSGC